MYEFTLRIETSAGTATSEETRSIVDESLQACADISRPRTTLDPATGTIAATFRAQAETVDAAQEVGIRVFSEALEHARLEADDHGWLHIEAYGP